MPHKNESPFDTLKNESTRQRWELFHRAIAHAKQSNIVAMQESDLAEKSGEPAEQPGRSDPLLSIAR